MFSVLLPTLFLNLFSFFNLLGIKKGLIPNQLIYLLIALTMYFVAKKINLFFFRSNAKFFYWTFIFLLIITYLIGDVVRGSKRWIDFYIFNFQPSEFFKIFFIIYFADFFARYKNELDDPKRFLKALFYFLLPTFLIFRQPDLGNALVFVVIFFSMLLFSSTPRRYLFYVLVFCLITLPLSWFFLHDYQRDRLSSFISPEINQRGTSYNMTQSIITAGSGQFLGKGLGYGTQSKLFFLPENHTDFAYASLVEQFGFIGGLVVLALYVYLIVFLIRKMFHHLRSKDEESLFLSYFLVGIFAFFSFQVLINIGMNLGLFPIVGIALPLISYGGSSLVSLFFLFGLIP